MYDAEYLQICSVFKSQVVYSSLYWWAILFVSNYSEHRRMSQNTLAIALQHTNNHSEHLYNHRTMLWLPLKTFWSTVWLEIKKKNTLWQILQWKHWPVKSHLHLEAARINAPISQFAVAQIFTVTAMLKHQFWTGWNIKIYNDSFNQPEVLKAFPHALYLQVSLSWISLEARACVRVREACYLIRIGWSGLWCWQETGRETHTLLWTI